MVGLMDGMGRRDESSEGDEIGTTVGVNVEMAIMRHGDYEVGATTGRDRRGWFEVARPRNG
jgi:hypothetical protein